MAIEKETMSELDSERGYGVATASGGLYYPADPQPEDIKIEDIAAQLARICRFNGALRHDISFYSVAQHSVLVSHCVPADLAMEGLLHDAHEAYVHDIVKPLKMMLPDYQRCERINEREVRAKFGLPRKMSPEVKEIDTRMLVTEVRDLCETKTGIYKRLLDMAEPIEGTITPWVPGRARDVFLDRYKELAEHVC